MKKIKRINIPVLLFIVMMIIVLSSEFYPQNSLYLKAGILILLGGLSITFLLIKNYLLMLQSGLLLIVILLFVFLLGQQYHAYQKAKPWIYQSIGVLGYIDSYPINKKGKTNFIFKVVGIKKERVSDYYKISPINILVKCQIDQQNSFKKGHIYRIDKKISLPVSKIRDFYYRKYLFYNKIYGIMSIKKEHIRPVKTIKINPVNLSFITQIRTHILKKLKNDLSVRAYSFIVSIFFGLKNELSSEIYHQFKNTGLVHLLAISGLHIGFIGSLLFRIFHCILSKSKSYLLSIIILYLYILMIIPSPSSYRAFFMFTIQASYFILGKKSISMTYLSLSGIILLFINPFSIFNLGFQLSFLATAGILLFAQKMILMGHTFMVRYIKISLVQNLIVRLKLIELFSVTLSAFLTLFMIQWSYFGKIPVFSLISSIFMVPLFSLIFCLSFFIIIFNHFVSLAFVHSFLNFMIELFLKIICLLDQIPALSWPKIPKISAYIFLFLLFILFHIILPQIFILVKRIKKKSYMLTSF